MHNASASIGATLQQSEHLGIGIGVGTAILAVAQVQHYGFAECLCPACLQFQRFYLLPAVGGVPVEIEAHLADAYVFVGVGEQFVVCKLEV